MTRHAASPDVSPLLDVMLVLTVLFVPVILDRPRVIYAQIDDGIVDRWPSVTIVAGRNETIRIHGHPCTVGEIRNRTVRLVADSGARYQDVMHALDVARGAGARVILELPRHP